MIQASPSLHPDLIMACASTPIYSITPTCERVFKNVSGILARDVQEASEEDFQSHFQKSKTAIMKAATGLRGKALFIGAGGCHDLPDLPWMASQFEEIVLVDIDREPVDSVVRTLAPALCAKFTIIQADASGFLAELSTKVERIINAQPFPDFIDFQQKVLKLLPTLTRQPLQMQLNYPLHTFSFVCSSLIASQLSNGIQEYLANISYQHYFQHFAYDGPFTHDPEYDVTTLAEVEHIRDISSLVQPKGGVVYFADNLSIEEHVI